jgi:hypothetical protein
MHEKDKENEERGSWIKIRKKLFPVEFQRALTLAMKMETVCFSETLVSIDESTQRQNPEEHHHPHRRDNLKSHI